MQVIHLTAKANGSHRPFEDFNAAAWTWNHLREAFPRTFACELMPKHSHLAALVDDGEEARRRFARTLGRMAACFAPGKDLWEDVPPPKILVGRKAILTAIRYVLLNACYARLVGDPLAWPWSTYRDVLGACIDPWVKASDLAPILDCAVREVEERLHAYIMRDAAVVATHTLPRPAPSTDTAAVSLQAIEAAVAAAMRIPRSKVAELRDARRLFVALARHQGWDNCAAIGRVLGVDRTTVLRCGAVPDQWTAAAATCLGDVRLLGSGLAAGASPWATAAAAALTGGPASRPELRADIRALP